jgi:serine/threonine-protein kinase RsbT
MALTRSDPFPLRSDEEVVLARQAIRRIAVEMGFSIVEQTKIVTATSEIARNAYVYGISGRLHWEKISNGSRQGLRVTVSDDGPGIEDVNLALKDGWTSGKGLGMGLPGAKRLVNDFSIESKPGVGTTVTITRWK